MFQSQIHDWQEYEEVQKEEFDDEGSVSQYPLEPLNAPVSVFDIKKDKECHIQ